MPPNDPHLDLSVKSTAGTMTDRWNKSNHAQRVYDDAVKYFSLSKGGQFVLKRERDGRELALGEKLGDLGLADGDILILQPRQAIDG